MALWSARSPGGLDDCGCMDGGITLRPSRQTVVQQESAQGAEMSRAAQNMAEDPHAQKARVEPSAAQTLSTKDATGPGDTKPGLEAAKIEMSGRLPEASGEVERLRPKKASKASERFDRIGLEIAALLATAAPAAGRSIAAAPIARRQARTVRHDAFDPSLNPNAPGAPRPLGTVAATTREQREPKRLGL